MLTKPLLTRQRTQLDSATREAEGYLELGMHSQALRSLQRRGTLVHANARACFLMGEALREMRRFDEAIYPLRRALALRPKAAETALSYGWCAKRVGRLGEAIHALEVAIAESPEDALLHYNLACYYSLAGRRLDAVRRLKTAFGLNGALRELIANESDFDAMRDDIALRMLLAAPV